MMLKLLHSRRCGLKTLKVIRCVRKMSPCHAEVDVLTSITLCIQEVAKFARFHVNDLSWDFPLTVQVEQRMIIFNNGEKKPPPLKPVFTFSVRSLSL